MLEKLRERFSSHLSWLSLDQRSRFLPMLLTFGVGLALTLGAFFSVQRWEHGEQQAELNYASKHYVEAIRRATERIELANEVIRQDYYGSPSVSREEFSLCAAPFLDRAPSLKVLQWAPLVTAGQREQFEREAHRDGFPAYQIVQPDVRGQLMPAKPRSEYFPIWFAASKTGFEARFGWDFAANPVLLNAIDQCRDANKFVISDPIDLSAIGVRGTVIQTFFPIYDKIRNPKAVSERRGHLQGLLVGLCQVDDLVERALAYSAGPQGIDVTLWDESPSQGHRMLHYHASRLEQDGESTPTHPSDVTAEEMHFTAAMMVGGHRWSLVCTPAPSFFAVRATWRSWTALLIGLFVSVLAAGYALSAATRTQRIERIVTERTLELRKKDDELRQSQKLEAVGSLAGGIAHEFNNLLQAIGGYTRYAMEELNPQEQPHQDLQNVLQAADRAKSLTRQLLSFSRRQTVERKNLNANDMVGDVTKMLRPLLGENIQLKVILSEDVGTVFADGGSFQQVLLNLCLNARDAMPTGGEILVKTRNLRVTPDFAKLHTDIKPGRYVQLSVADTGQGMPASVREHIFEPFFTTKPIGKGTGLGLSVVYGIIQQHEGAIHVYSEPGHGTEFKIYLPCIDAEADAPTSEPSLAAFGGSETILVAEDDPMVRDIARRILEKAGYKVLLAVDGDEALVMFNAHRQDISLVLLDAIMPKLGGHEAYHCIRHECPDVRVIFCSGYDPETAQSQFVADENLRLVQKPYDPGTLLRAVREVLDAEKLCPTH